jgi:sulfoxide reductase heme-binding subunit YedZ
MSQKQFNNTTSKKQKKHISYELIAFILLAIMLGAAWFYLSSAGSASLNALMGRIFMLDSQQVMWFITRSAGIIAYILLWLSTVWGLAIPTKLFGNRLNGEFTFDFHQALSLLSLGFLGLHIFILTADRYLPYTLAQILVPFLSPYRPIWVGIGTLSLYLLILVTVTFYLRQRISMKTFRYIHFTSMIAYLGAVAHAFMAGTDSSLPVMQLLYAGTFMVVVLLTVYWLAALLWNRLTGDTRVVPNQ